MSYWIGESKLRDGTVTNARIATFVERAAFGADVVTRIDEDEDESDYGNERDEIAMALALDGVCTEVVKPGESIVYWGHSIGTTRYWSSP